MPGGNEEKNVGMIKSIVLFVIFFWCMQNASLASGELVVVVHASNESSSVSQEEVASIFLGKQRELPDGTKVVPLDQMEGKKSRDEFYTKVVNKTANQLNSYWSRLIFTGKGRPPFAVSGDAEVLEFISSNPNMIGYVDVLSLQNSNVSSQVKVLLTIR